MYPSTLEKMSLQVHMLPTRHKWSESKDCNSHRAHLEPSMKMPIESQIYLPDYRGNSHYPFLIISENSNKLTQKMHCHAYPHHQALDLIHPELNRNQVEVVINSRESRNPNTFFDTAITPPQTSPKRNKLPEPKMQSPTVYSDIEAKTTAESSANSSQRHQSVRMNHDHSNPSTSRKIPYQASLSDLTQEFTP